MMISTLDSERGSWNDDETIIQTGGGGLDGSMTMTEIRGDGEKKPIERDALAHWGGSRVETEKLPPFVKMIRWIGGEARRDRTIRFRRESQDRYNHDEIVAI